MTFQLQAISHRFADSGAVYLSQRQEESPLLIVNLTCTAKAVGTTYENKEYNPDKAVYSRITFSYRGFIVGDLLQNYPAQQIYFRSPDRGDELARLMCQYFVHYGQQFERFFNTKIPIPVLVPALQFAPQQLPPLRYTNLDTIRVEGDTKPSQFEVQMHWLEPVVNAADPCQVPRPNLPSLSPVPAPSQMPSPGAGRSLPNGAFPVPDSGGSGSLLPGNSQPPQGVLPGDFGIRNGPVFRPFLFQRGRISRAINGSCVQSERVATLPLSAGQQPPSFAGVASAVAASVPPVVLQSGGTGNTCGVSVLTNGVFAQAGTVIESGASGLITYSWPLFKVFSDGQQPPYELVS